MALKTTRISAKEAKVLYSKTIPNYLRYAVTNTLTGVVYRGMGYSEKWLKRNWVTRNNFLLGGGTGKGAVKYNRAKPKQTLNSIWASWGSPGNVGSKDYSFMAKQQGGFRHEGSTPGNMARVGKKYSKKIPNKMRRRTGNIEELRGSVSSKRMTLIYLRRNFKRGFGLPGSGKFFYMKDNQFLNFGAGLYQFTRKTIPNKLSSSGARLQFPNLKKVYTAGKQNRKTRKDSQWMVKSSARLKQAEIERIFNKAADQAFANQLKLWKHY